MQRCCIRCRMSRIGGPLYGENINEGAIMNESRVGGRVRRAASRQVRIANVGLVEGNKDWSHATRDVGQTQTFAGTTTYDGFNTPVFSAYTPWIRGAWKQKQFAPSSPFGSTVTVGSQASSKCATPDFRGTTYLPLSGCASRITQLVVIPTVD